MHLILDKIYHLLIPRESNNHRAKILHHSSLLVIILLLIITNIGFSFTRSNYPEVLGITNNISVDDLVQRTNQKRVEQGLVALSFNEALADAARRKAQHMLDNNYWAHNAPDGTTPWVFFKNAGYNYFFAGENLARGFSNTDDVMNAWMASPGHRENILSPNYKEVGFAVLTGNLTGEETVLVVEMFGSSNSSVTQATTSQETAQEKVIPTSTPAPIVMIVTTTAPTQVVARPTLQPTKAPASEIEIENNPTTSVASFESSPLLNEKSLSKNITLLLVLLLLGVILLDFFIIERKKIVRLVSHSIDHIIFLSIILITIILFGKGLIL